MCIRDRSCIAGIPFFNNFYAFKISQPYTCLHKLHAKGIKPRLQLCIMFHCKKLMMMQGIVQKHRMQYIVSDENDIFS